jgi:plastocyanin domain-containing protein
MKTIKMTNKMMIVGVLILIAFGVIMAGQGLGLSDIFPTVFASSSEKSTATNGVAVISGNVQNVTIDLGASNYAPIIVQKGIPVRFNIRAKAENINSCNGTVIISKFNIQKTLKAGDNIIEFTPDKTGKISYSCWMGMVRSNITVVDDVSKITAKDVKKAAQGIKSGSGMPCCSGL